MDGTCHCGRITYRATVEPAVLLCHCADCQQLSGSPYRAMVGAKADDFSISGDPKIYIKRADSGARRAQAFCPDCGSPIYSADADAPAMYGIRLGGINQRAELGMPVQQIWCESMLDWAQNIEAIPGRAGQ
jgi:hypothetical protein